MKKIILITLFLMFVFTGCSTVKTQEINSQKQPLEPKQVVENYFKYYNEKNLEGVNSTRTQWSQITTGLDENLKYIKLNSISEDVPPTMKEGYIKYGNGLITGAKEENITIYKIEFTVKYKKDRVGPQDSGKYIKWCTLIRKDENSPWLIDEIGEG
ncbi:DUF4829 domain-containing protein [Clostridium sp. CX1]|uniref:DUF4829 domain-containing protein n=1 Tax=Clostridium sp. CX1 TaxID=2978346 RepID=UPI0021C0AAAE|nr:DUF4829 domain-containing protein [Clostridium sp. CX1]MCT8977388.1 DUF4829 domain-containing protein [Clostridium sp. CX1]